MRSAPLFALAFAALGCQAVLAPPRASWPELNDGHFMNVGAFLQVTGTGKASGPISSETQERSLARDAALLDAWARLTRYLEALPHPPPHGRVGARARADAAYQASVERLARSATIVSTDWDKDGRAIVILRLLRASVNPALETELK